MCCHQHLAKFGLFIEKNRSHRAVLKSNGPRNDPWGTAKSISFQELYAEPVLVLCCLFFKELCINVNAEKLSPKACNFASKISCERQSKTIDKSLRSPINGFPLSAAGFHFSNIFKRQYCMLHPFLKTL